MRRLFFEYLLPYGFLALYGYLMSRSFAMMCIMLALPFVLMFLVEVYLLCIKEPGE